MRIKPKNLMAHGIKGRLREAWPMEAFELLAEHRRDIDSCGGWRWIRGWLLSLILWWIRSGTSQRRSVDEAVHRYSGFGVSNAARNDRPTAIGTRLSGAGDRAARTAEARWDSDVLPKRFRLPSGLRAE